MKPAFLDIGGTILDVRGVVCVRERSDKTADVLFRESGLRGISIYESRRSYKKIRKALTRSGWLG